MPKTSRIPRERESKVQRSVVVRLQRLGIVLFRRNVAVFTASHNGKSRAIRCGKVGQSDLYGWHIRTGLHFEIETKRSREVPTPKQLEWLKECTCLGAASFWGDNANTIERVAEAVLGGGRIVWRNDGTFDVEMP